MLKHLLIENYALIHKLDTEFNEGLTAITGETGAGKSILLGALSLILGERADTKVLNNKSRKCIIEGTFNLEYIDAQSLFDFHDLDYETISFFRREITPNGKSRAFINDTPVTLPAMKAIAERLIDIHSQHQSLMVSSSAFQFVVVDAYAKNIEGIENYRTLFKQYQQQKKDLLAAVEAERTARADLDYYQYQVNELDKAGLNPEGFKEMEEELGVLKHAEEILYNLEKSLFMLEGSDHNLLDAMNGVISLIKPLERFGNKYQELCQRLESVAIETKDVVADAVQIKDKIVHNPQHVATLEMKLDEINKLLMKHHAGSVEELSGIRDDFQEKINATISMEENISRMQEEISNLEKDVYRLASDISSLRKKAIPAIQKEILAMLKNLGMPGARFSIQQEKTGSLTMNGLDKLCFMFNANVGGEMQEISRVASGGELSRVMLSIKSMISQKRLLPTIIFDEIDTGISGETTTRVANILHQMSKNMQVVAITHLPQIASKANTHLLVYKQVENGETRTRLKMLDQDQRIEEVAKMLGGKKPTKYMVETAKELIFNKDNKLSK